MSSPTPPTPMGGNRSLNHSLKSHRLTIIFIGDAIGTGLFVASGATISSAGPGGTLLAYGLIGLMVRLIMQFLGEIAAFLSASGSFGGYGRRFMPPSFGFAMGWNYWFNRAIAVTTELVAIVLIMGYWFPHVPSILWSGLFLLILFGISALSTKTYGESEFWFATIKVLAVIVFLILGFVMILGIIGEAPRTQNWTADEAPFVGGAEGVFLVILAAGYSFQGTELIGVTAGETGDPGRTVPCAIRTIFWKTLLFHIGAITVIGFLIPYTDPSLLNSSETNISVSPFTLVFNKTGILTAASLVNAVILTSIPSTGISGPYASARTLFAPAKKGHTLRFLKKLSKHQVPVNAPLTTTLVGLAGLITSFVGDGKAYEFLLTVSALAGFTTRIGISWSHYRFRKALAIQNISPDSLPYRARFFPTGAIVALVACVLTVVGQPYGPLRGGAPLGGLLLPFIGISFLLALRAGHKLVTKEPAVDLVTADLGRG